jgi:hypothetical protein
MAPKFGIMRSGKACVFSIILVAALATTASAQFPFYDIELAPVCIDSAGVQTNATSAKLYILGRNGFDVVYQYYFLADGQKIVPDTSATIYDRPCWEVKRDTASGYVYESAFSTLAFDTIPPGLYTAVTIINIGIDTHSIFVGDLGSTYRMKPGEHYKFNAYYDPVARRQVKNPEIFIAQGVVGSNYLRIHLQE